MKTNLSIVILVSVFLFVSSVVFGEQDKPETVTDFDGNVYSTVKIGDQTWLAENLRSTHYSDGKPLESFPANGDESNSRSYGRLYCWQAAVGGPSFSEKESNFVQGASPEGWHIPTEEDWLELTNYLGSESTAGAKLKGAGFNNPDLENNNSTNGIGFGALAAGWFDFSGEYLGFGKKTFLVSSTSPNGRGGFAWELNDGDSTFIRVFLHPDDAISIRCVKD
ncbi:MAG: hypothetical protein GY780_08770, partial [bacterium]|nr:hypothetical protein [bacterium]